MQLRAYFIFSALALALMGCQPAAPVEPVKPVKPVTPAFFLRCTGTAIEPLGRNAETKLYRIPSPESGEQLTVYREEQKLFYEICPSDIFSCSTQVTPELITLMGGNSEIRMTYSTIINRLTGVVSEYIKVDGSVLSSFNGTCERAEAPPEEKPKF
jgi:hypothetical protein